MYKKNLLKATSVFTAFALACGSMTGCGLFGKNNEDTTGAATEEKTEEDQAAEELAETMEKTAFTGSRENAESGKEETVYVMTDANGSVNDIVVSNWLKNKDGSAEIKDTTNLKDIVNVKGDESYTDNGDGTVTWKADGSDIYYQGTPTQELPIGVKVTYTLDGKEMTPEEIAGKSGKVTIRFDYENNLKESVKIDGEDTDVDVPFTMISGTMLDNTKFSNVKVSKGKVISDANNYVIVGVAMPGLKESLKIDDEKLEEEGIDKDDVEIPDYVEITANVDNFELPMTISMASANVISDLGLDKIYNSDKIDTLNDDMDELSDASTQLVDGSGELSDGTGKLADGTGEFVDGTGKLADGTGKLKDGTTELSNGVADLKSGTAQIRDGAGQLSNGSGTLASGAKTLAGGVSSYTDAVGKLATGATTLDKGVGTLASGSKELTSGIKSAKDGATQLSNGADQLSAGITTLSDGISTNLSAATLAKNTFGAEYQDVIQVMAAKASGNTVAASGAVANSGSAEVYDLLNELTALLTDATNKLQDEASSAADKAKVQKEEIVEEAEEPEEEQDNNAAPAENNVPENSGENADNTDNTTPNQNENTDNGAADNSSSGDSTSESETSPSNDDNNADASGAGSEEVASQENATQEDSSSNEESQPNEGNEAVTEDNASNDNAETADSSEENTSLDEQVTLESGEPESTDAAGTDSVEGFDEYASDAGWQAVYGLTEKDKSYWDAVYAAAKGVVTMSSDVTNNIYNDQNVKLASIYGTIAKCYSGEASLSDPTTAAIFNTYKDSTDPDPATAQAAGYTNSFIAKYAGKGLGKLQPALASTNTATATMAGTAYASATQIYMTYLTLQSAETIFNTIYNGTGNGGLKDIQAGAQQLATGADSLETGLDKLYTGGKKLDKGVGTLKNGTKKLAKGAKTLDGNSDALSTGASKLSSGAYELSEGAAKLYNGTGELDDGAGKLYDGVGELANGVTELDDGAKKLDDGAKELNDGAKQLDDGARKLADGMIEFDEDGIQKLTTTVDDDLLSVTDRLKAVDEASQSFKTFSGANSDEPSSVQFIIRTEGISADED